MQTVKRFFRWFFSWRGLAVILLIFFVIAPVMDSCRLEIVREAAISALEETRGSRVIVLVHRQESVNVLGVPVVCVISISPIPKMCSGPFGSPTQRRRWI